MRELGNNIAKI